MLNQVRDVHFLSEEYPISLRDLPDPPRVLSVEGALSFGERPVLGVVGARDSSVMSESWLRRFLTPLASKCVIVSGGARGIDELAHQIAVSQKSPTAVILPSALDRPYPSDWLFKKQSVLQAGGCLISEYEAGVEVRKWNFEKRNRLIAALSDVVLVVEARRRSGTGITARHARDLGRIVATIPWFPTDPRGELCNDLLVDGAMLVRDSMDIESLLNRELHGRLMRNLRAIGTPHGEPGVRFEAL